MDSLDINLERIAFYHELGLSITQWAHVERALFGVCVVCAKPPNLAAMHAAFRKIENFRSKLDYASELVLGRCAGGPFETEWASLAAMALAAARDRNHLAHRHTMCFPMGSPGRRQALLLWVDKGQSPPEGKAPSSAWCVRDIMAKRFRFVRIMMALENFSAKLDGIGQPFPQHGVNSVGAGPWVDRAAIPRAAYANQHGGVPMAVLGEAPAARSPTAAAPRPGRCARTR